MASSKPPLATSGEVKMSMVEGLDVQLAVVCCLGRAAYVGREKHCTGTALWYPQPGGRGQRRGTDQEQSMASSRGAGTTEAVVANSGGSGLCHH